MEIERKYLITEIPFSLEAYPFRQLTQGYLCTDPVVRVRKDNEHYELTYKGKGLLVREEYNLPLTEASFLHLLKKADGRIISKVRYMIPLNQKLTIELDIFQKELAPLMMAEVEFPDEQSANDFQPPSWFGEEVTFSKDYHNSTLSQR